MKVLAGVDLRTTGHDWLVDQASAFADLTGATLDLVYVTTPGLGPGQPSYEADKAALSTLLRLQAEEPNRGEARVEPGDVVEVLVQLSEGYDAVVVGPREGGPIERMLHGPMCVRVSRLARSPVLVARRELDAGRPPKLLIGIDMNRGDPWPMLEEGLHWARKTGGTIDAVYVDAAPMPIANRHVRDLARREWQASRAPQVQALHELMERVEPEHRGEARVSEGNPETVLVKLSKEVDIVLVGTRERPGVAGYILGSVAKFVVRRAHCSVLTLPTAHREG